MFNVAKPRHSAAFVLRAAMTGSVALGAMTAFQAAAQAQSAGRIEGTVTVPGGGFADGATVTIPALGLSAAADREGRFAFANVPAGTHEIVVRFSNAPEQRQSVTVTPGTAATVNVAMTTGGATAEEEVVVVGSRPIAESEEAALRAQRNSPALVAVVSSDAVGRLPDQNIAAAAGRLPGVAVQRDQGQSRYLSLRGGPITWSTLSFDGVSIISPEGRDSRYDSIPSAIASQIVVRKVVTPDMTGETVSGNINVITRTPFDYPGMKIAAKAGVGYVTLGGGEEYDGSLVFSNRWQTSSGEFGVVASASFYERNMATDNFETDWEAVTQDQQPGAATRFWARETENKIYRLTRRNWSLSGRADWRTDNTRLFVSSIYTIFTDDELRDNHIFDLDDRQGDNTRGATPCTIAFNPTPTNTGYGDVCIGNTPFRGFNYGVDINTNIMGREFKQSIWTNTLGGNHVFGAWEIDWRLNYTKSEDDRSHAGQLNYDSPAARDQRPTVFYDLTDSGNARVELYRTIALTGPTRFQAGARVGQIEDFARPLSRVRQLDAVDTTEAYTAKIDAAWEGSLLGGDATLRFGFQYDQRAKEAVENLLDVSGANLAALVTAGLPNTTAATEIQKAYLGRLPLGYSFRYFGKPELEAIVARVRAAGFTNQFVTGNYFDVGEKVYAGYALADIDYSWGSVLAGLRVEHVQNDANAFAVVGGVSRPVSVESSETLFYPSVNVNFDIDETKKLRLSFNTGAARPDYSVMRPNFVVDDANRTISGGNPEAKPEKTWGIDGYFEWYIEPRGYFMVGLTYKNVSDVLASSTRVFGLDTLNIGGTDRSQYILSTAINAGDGYLWGAEVALQLQLDPWVEQFGLPEWMGGFGIQANASYNKSEVELPGGRTVSLPGTSEWVTNLALYYEKYGFSGRVVWQHRTAWFDALGGPDTGGDLYWAADDELDVSLRYAFTERFEAYIDGKNLLNGAGRRFAGIKERTLEYEKFGTIVSIGVRLTY
jgi:TonB-dependent receptor